jgi:hypothetical protein
MAQNVSADISLQLSRIFSNGVTGVGLEVGADAGLAPEEYIQIPHAMRKQWAYRTVGEGGYERKAEDTTAALADKANWNIVRADNAAVSVQIYSGEWYVTVPAESGAPRTRVDDVYVDPHTYDDLRMFLRVNEGHLREGSLDAEHLYWVQAARFWGTATGLVVGPKNKEYVFVDNPVGDLNSVNDLAGRVASFSNEALTAAAARGVNWRKSNHATGGKIASGMADRWLKVMKFYPEGNDPTDKKLRDDREKVTSAFYVGTHAISVHAVLAIMAPEDPGHWAQIDPRYGLVYNWTVMTSTKVRISAMTQVAGTAMVVDAVVVLKQLAASCLAPLLENYSEWRTLMARYREVETMGVRAASYAQWFLDGHPGGVRPSEFNQKDSACAALVGELAVVAKSYYAGSSIGASMALENAKSQLASETCKDLWAALTRERKSASSEAIIQAYKRILGAASAGDIAALASSDKEIARAAVTRYNDNLAVLSTELGLAAAPTVDFTRIEFGVPEVDV